MEDNGYTAFHFNLTDFCVVETAYTETYNCTVVDVCATKSFKVSQTVINTEACIPTLAVFISLFASIGNINNTFKTIFMVWPKKLWEMGDRINDNTDNWLMMITWQLYEWLMEQIGNSPYVSFGTEKLSFINIHWDQKSQL